jgi:hypothetical protein
MRSSIFSGFTPKWLGLTLLGMALFAAGMWFDYSRTPPPSANKAPADIRAAAAPASVISTSGAFPKPASGLFIAFEGLGPENHVSGQVLTVRGVTAPDAILSVDGVRVPVSLEGRFETVLQLEPGPNFVEFVASDLTGAQTSRVVALMTR